MNMRLMIKPVLCRARQMDNYAYVLKDQESGVSAVLDASEAEPVIEVCEELGLKPDYVFVTHHHYDHTDGNTALKEKYGLKIVGPEAERSCIKGLDIGLSDGDSFFLGTRPIKIISAPGHTMGHILWYFPDDKVLFTGDVLFNLTIGGLFEGTAVQMFESLQKIKKLPDDVLFYPGHEYTLGTLRYLPCDDHLKEYTDFVSERIKNNLPASPVPLGLEKKCNPFLKVETLEEFVQQFER